MNNRPEHPQQWSVHAEFTISHDGLDTSNAPLTRTERDENGVRMVYSWSSNPSTVQDIRYRDRDRPSYNFQKGNLMFSSTPPPRESDLSPNRKSTVTPEEKTSFSRRPKSSPGESDFTESATCSDRSKSSVSSRLPRQNIPVLRNIQTPAQNTTVQKIPLLNTSLVQNVTTDKTQPIDRNVSIEKNIQTLQNIKTQQKAPAQRNIQIQQNVQNLLTLKNIPIVQVTPSSTIATKSQTPPILPERFMNPSQDVLTHSKGIQTPSVPMPSSASTTSPSEIVDQKQHNTVQDSGYSSDLFSPGSCNNGTSQRKILQPYNRRCRSTCSIILSTEYTDVPKKPQESESLQVEHQQCGRTQSLRCQTPTIRCDRRDSTYYGCGDPWCHHSTGEEGVRFSPVPENEEYTSSAPKKPSRASTFNINDGKSATSEDVSVGEFSSYAKNMSDTSGDYVLRGSNTSGHQSLRSSGSSSLGTGNDSSFRFCKDSSFRSCKDSSSYQDPWESKFSGNGSFKNISRDTSSVPKDLYSLQKEPYLRETASVPREPYFEDSSVISADVAFSRGSRFTPGNTTFAPTNSTFVSFASDSQCAPRDLPYVPYSYSQSSSNPLSRSFSHRDDLTNPLSANHPSNYLDRFKANHRESLRVHLPQAILKDASVQTFEMIDKCTSPFMLDCSNEEEETRGDSKKEMEKNRRPNLTRRKRPVYNARRRMTEPIFQRAHSPNSSLTPDSLDSRQVYLVR